ncbi:MAG: DUF6036 family nucleotidyltransferase [Pseudobdellovibrionaceae bacterium]
MTEINSRLLRQFVNMACERLTGDWVIIGGTVLPILGVNYRVTIDIDVAKGQKESPDQTLELMKIAEDLNLPIEAINQAGSFFLRKIKNWESNLVLLKGTKSTKIFRPNATLFFQLKIARLTQNDLQDCLEMLKNLKKIKEPMDAELIIGKLFEEIKIEKSDPERKIRLSQLLEAVKGFSKS